MTKTKSLLAFALAMVAAGLAQAAPDSIDDKAGFFSAEGKAKAEAAIKRHEEQRKYERIFVETYPDIPADRRAGYSEEKKNQFFENWAKVRLSAHKVPGVLILITRQPPHLHVEATPELAERIFTKDDAKAVRTLLVSSFSAKSYDSGLEQAVKAISDAIRKNSRSNLRIQAFPVRTNPEHEEIVRKKKLDDETGKSAGFDWTILLWIGGGLFALWIVVGLIRGMARPALPPAAYGPGPQQAGVPPGYGGYPAPGYGPGYPPPAGGGGFMGNMLGGMFGAVAGNYLYDQFFRSHGMGSSAGSFSPTSPSGPLFNEPPSEPRWAGAGGDFGPDEEPRGAGAGGDFGPADGGGDMGGDYAGGDFGADPGGGDFGGAGGDFGGGDFAGGGDFGGTDNV